MTIASVLAWEVGVLLGAPHPTFAILAVLFSLQGNAAGSLRTAGQRLLGVVGGVVVGMAAIHGPGISAPTVGLLLLVSLLAGSMPRIGGRPNVQVAVSALLLLSGGGGWRYGLTRLWETAMGGALAVAVSALLWPAHPVRETQSELRRLGGLLADDLRRVAGLFTLDARRARARLAAVRAHSREAEELRMDFPDLVSTLRWNPWRDREAVARTRTRLEAMTILYRHACSLTRIAADFAATPTGRPPAAQPLTEALEALARAASALADPARRPPAVDVGSWIQDLMQAGGEPAVVGAVASELGHLAADLRAWLADGREAG